METGLTAIELTGIVNEKNQLELDSPLPITGPQRVRVIVLYTESGSPDEMEWLRSATRNPAFADLADSAEDIYLPTDGKPIDAQA